MESIKIKVRAILQCEPPLHTPVIKVQIERIIPPLPPTFPDTHVMELTEGEAKNLLIQLKRIALQVGWEK